MMDGEGDETKYTMGISIVWPGDLKKLLYPCGDVRVRMMNHL